MKKRPYIVSVAGFDPSGGAGILADIKTFEAHKTIGLGVSTALTYQTEDSFLGLDWHTEKQIEMQLEPLLKRYPIEIAKIGLVENLNSLNHILGVLLHYQPGMKIIWDPILKASAGFTFHEGIRIGEIENMASKLEMITPNQLEIKSFYPHLDPMEGAQELSNYCKVFLKGGHDAQNPGKDRLFESGLFRSYNPTRLVAYPKHGSGCIVSAAIAAGIAKGYPLNKAILKAKKYVSKVLLSNKTLLGYHY